MSTQYEPFANVIGRVGRGGAEVRNEGRVVRFSVAKRQGFGDGETQWYDVDVWRDKKNGEHNPLFDKVKNLQQGQLVAVEAMSSKARTVGERVYLTLPAINVWRLTDIGEADGDEW